MATRNERIVPFMAVHPGGVLKSELEARGLRQKVFATEIGVQPSHLNEVVKGKRNITPAFAEKLEAGLGIPADFWMRMQKSYELDCIAIAERDEKEQTASVKEQALSVLCNIKALYKRLAISTDTFAQKRIEALREAFSCEPLEYASSLPRGAFKRSDRVNVDDKNLTTWLMLAVLAIKSNKPAGGYKEGNAKVAAEKIAALAHSGTLTEKDIKGILDEQGISYNVVEKLDSVPVDAYSTNAEGYPAIVVTHRYNDMARLVFNVLHELGHIHLHLKDKNEVFWTVGEDYSVNNQMEKEANIFAQDALISRQDWKAIMGSEVKGISPNIIIKHLKTASNERHLNFNIVSWRYMFETRCYNLGIKAQQIR